MLPIPLNRLADDERLLHTELLEEEMPYDFRRPHRHDYFECFVFLDGGGTHYIDFRAYPVVAGSIHLVFPGQVHLLRRRGARGIVIVCRKEVMATLPPALYQGLRNGSRAGPGVALAPGELAPLTAVVRALQEELRQPDRLSETIIRSQLYLLLANFLRAAGGAAADAPGCRALEQYHRFCSLLDASPLDIRLPVTHFASELGMSVKVLNGHIQRACGQPCLALLQDRLLTEAKRRLLYTGDTCKEIAWQLGFRDTSYFNRFFRRLEGSTPALFRARWEEKYHQHT